MKPLGIAFELLTADDSPTDLDDDYAWHVRRVKADRRAARQTGPISRTRRAGRLVAFVRTSLAGRGASATHRA